MEFKMLSAFLLPLFLFIGFVCFYKSFIPLQKNLKELTEATKENNILLQQILLRLGEKDSA